MQIPDFLIAPGIAAVVLLLLIAVALILPNDDRAGSPGAVSRMGTARWKHTATLLPTGKVLVAGGQTGRRIHFTASAEFYDPSSNTWSSAGSMVHSRQDHTATLLPGGKVLAAGGKWLV